MGNAEKPINTPSTSNFSNNGIRKVLNLKNQQVIKATGNKEKGLIVLIKPSDKSNYKNLVDILDELKIAGVDNYMIVDNTPSDLERMKAYAIY